MYRTHSKLEGNRGSLLGSSLQATGIQN
uniref:Uncharacterized protein n=1 Tax=Rhizophora mucronata TaxID=61149 RepID=A0A2P2PCJ8_RHIMU